MNIILPGLWTLLRTIQQHEPAIGAELPSLIRLLARCDRSAGSDRETEDRALEKLGLDECRMAPVAALERLAEQDRDTGGWWLRADPVCLVADRQFIVMQHPGCLELDLAEARQLIDLVNSHFAEDGWQLEQATQGRWHLRLPAPLDVITTPTWRVIGKDIDPYLPAGKDGLKWHAWLNEIQMLLYSAPLNDQRIAAGKPPVNGLWVWGAGSISDPSSPETRMTLWGRSPFLRGLARHAGLTHHDLPADWESVCDAMTDGDGAMVWLDQARNALASGNVEQGIEVLKKLEQDVFLPMLERLNKGRISRLNLIDVPGNEVQVSSRGLRRWWRNRKPVPDLQL